MRRTTLMLLLVTACASQTDAIDLEDPEASSTGNADDTRGDAPECSPPELDACVADDDVAACSRGAIKHEYEMLEARAKGDRTGFACHRGTLVALHDHACKLGDDQACTQATLARGVEPRP